MPDHSSSTDAYKHAHAIDSPPFFNLGKSFHRVTQFLRWRNISKESSIQIMPPELGEILREEMQK
jgi:hypothetical protein